MSQFNWNKISQIEEYPERFTNVKPSISYCDKRVKSTQNGIDLIKSLTGQVLDDTLTEIRKGKLIKKFKCDDIIVKVFVSKSSEITYLNVCEFEYIVAENLVNGRFVIVGCTNSHPNVVTNEFSYCNSDGSGPNILKNYQEITLESLLQRVDKYYRAFCDNRYH